MTYLIITLVALLAFAHVGLRAGKILMTGGATKVWSKRMLATKRKLRLSRPRQYCVDGEMRYRLPRVYSTRTTESLGCLGTEYFTPSSLQFEMNRSWKR